MKGFLNLLSCGVKSDSLYISPTEMRIHVRSQILKQNYHWPSIFIIHIDGHSDVVEAWVLNFLILNDWSYWIYRNIPNIDTMYVIYYGDWNTTYLPVRGPLAPHPQWVGWPGTQPLPEPWFAVLRDWWDCKVAAWYLELIFVYGNMNTQVLLMNKTLWRMGYLPYQRMLDLFHQQYHPNIIIIPDHIVSLHS